MNSNVATSSSLIQALRKFIYNLFGWILIVRKLSALEIEAAVKKAELGHLGEIAVFVSSRAPIFGGESTRERAIRTYAELKVGETEGNVGVLLFFCVSEKRIELVSDPVLKALVPDERWQEICSVTSDVILLASLEAGIYKAIELVGATLLNAIPGAKKLNQLTDTPRIS